jgi:hypothetical protein
MTERTPDPTLQAADHIPAEVLARAQKSGDDVPTPTWYAGRLEVDGQHARASDDDGASPPTAGVSDEVVGRIVDANRPPHPIRDMTMSGVGRVQQLAAAMLQLLLAFVRWLSGHRTERRPV